MNKNIKTCLVMYLLQTAVQTKENYTPYDYCMFNFKQTSIKQALQTA